MTVIPQLKEHSKYHKERMMQDFEQKEEELRSNFIAQKYQLKERQEHCKMVE
jgi:hypothetical protein